MRRAPRRALLVYSRVGGGHLSAARALATELEAQGDIETRLVDAYVECGRFPLPLFPRLYAALARRHPRLWALVYYGSDTRLTPPNLLRPFLSAGFKRVLKHYQPAVVISTLPVINGLLAAAAGRVGAPTEVVLTDWQAVHRSWVARGVAHYSTPTDCARLECVRLGASPAAVDTVGIPVRSEFAEAGAASDTRTRLLGEVGLDPRRSTIVAMVGAEGSPRAFNNVCHLAQMGLEAQLIVVCGHNDRLRQRLTAMPLRMPTRAIGFVEQVADLMRSADVLVTKAGGLTLAEAFCCRVPVVVHDVIPGQEAGNLDYARRTGAVEFASDPDELGRIVVDLVQHPARRAALAERGAELARPHAATEIAANVLRRLSSSLS